MVRRRSTCLSKSGKSASRTYPTRYVVLYQDQALRQPGYRLVWTTVTDEALKSAQVASLKEEHQDLARKKDEAAAKKKTEELDALTKKKDEAEKSKFKKGQADLEKKREFQKPASANAIRRPGTDLRLASPADPSRGRPDHPPSRGSKRDRHPIDHELRQRHGGDVQHLVWIDRTEGNPDATWAVSASPAMSALSMNSDDLPLPLRVPRISTRWTRSAAFQQEIGTLGHSAPTREPAAQ